MTRHADIESELWAEFPVDDPPPTPAPRRHVKPSRRVLCGIQGVILGLMSAIATDQLVGLPSPVPMMALYAIVGGWVWPDRHVLANRAIVARIVAAGIVTLPLCWMPVGVALLVAGAGLTVATVVDHWRAHRVDRKTINEPKETS